MMTFKVDQKLYSSFTRLRKSAREVDTVKSLGVENHAKEIETRLNAPMGYPTSHVEEVATLAKLPANGNHTPHSYSMMVTARDRVLDNLSERVGEDYLVAAQAMIEAWKHLAVVNSVARNLGASTTVSPHTLDKLFIPGSRRPPLGAHSHLVGPHTCLVSPGAQLKLLADDIKKLQAQFEYEEK